MSTLKPSHTFLYRNGRDYVLTFSPLTVGLQIKGLDGLYEVIGNSQFVEKGSLYSNKAEIKRVSK
jgi:hypothetical protein